MLLTTTPKKIDTIYAITKSEMVPIPHPTVRSKSAYSKNENRSLVNFTWTCNVSMVAFKTIVCPLFFNIKNYSFFYWSSLYRVAKTFSWIIIIILEMDGDNGLGEVWWQRTVAWASYLCLCSNLFDVFMHVCQSQSHKSYVGPCHSTVLI
jgi:hypothetical protein